MQVVLERTTVFAGDVVRGKVSAFRGANVCGRAPAEGQGSLCSHFAHPQQTHVCTKPKTNRTTQHNLPLPPPPTHNNNNKHEKKVYLQNSTQPISYESLYVEFSGEEHNWWQVMMSMHSGGIEAGGDMRDDYRIYSYTGEIVKVSSE